MDGSASGPLGQSRTTLPSSASGSINGMKVLMGVVLLVIGIASIAGVVMAVHAGEPRVALIVGLLATAFFARVGC